VPDSKTPATAPSAGKPLGEAAVEELLQRGLIARLACFDDADWPHVVPVWFEWDGHHFWVIATKRAAWVTYLVRNPRVALAIDDPITTRRMLVKGVAVIEEEPGLTGRWSPIARRMADRYLGERAVTYEADTAGLERWLLSIQPTRIVAWQGPSKDERE
jgi:hypothetical protein